MTQSKIFTFTAYQQRNIDGQPLVGPIKERELFKKKVGQVGDSIKTIDVCKTPISAGGISIPYSSIFGGKDSSKTPK